ncbi:MAG TPA: uroporphyrinogen decarboxylase family protein [Ruminiclostridium sp.]
MKEFTPDYTNIVKAAKNIIPDRMPLYEHAISVGVMEKILNKQFGDLANGSRADKKEFYRNYTGFYLKMGYDTVSFEQNIGAIMPGAGALGGHMPGAIKCREDFLKYPWDEIPELFFKKYTEEFTLLGEVMPQGMKAIGGGGYGVFELVQDIVGFTDLCYISVDDPELYADLFKIIGNVMYKIWDEILKKFGDTYCVCRFGDDLGYKIGTLIPPKDIRTHIIPQYKRLVELIHSYNKPFLLHSCGKIFDVMDEIIAVAKIDAKHSNEDQIAPFSEWVNRYGDKIGNFGGIDTDHLCRKNEQEIKEIVIEVIGYSIGHGGFALGSGNSIPDYVPVQGYLAMVEAARASRGE